MFTWWGGSRFLFLVLPMGVLLALAQWDPINAQQFLDWRLIEHELLSAVRFSQTSMIIMVVAVLLLNGRLFAQPTTQNSSLFVVLLSAIFMLYFTGNAIASSVFASAAMLMLVFAVVQESWSMAYIDQLTGLPGRRALDEAMLKLGNNFSIAMLDIDHFKKFNDRHGHDAGDQVLRMVAACIKQSNSGGKAYRYGGEEFTLLFSGKQTEEVLQSLEGVRQSIGNDKFQLRSLDRRRVKDRDKAGNKVVNVTVSIGVANCNDRFITPNEVIKGADKALYRAKRSGRNRVCQ
jgi:diguanylate cyclase (GGDEF)-like protein